MPHLPAEPPAFFHRGPSPLARLAFFGLLSIGLLVADARFGYLEGIRTVAAVVLAPLQRAARVPGEARRRSARFFASQRDAGSRERRAAAAAAGAGPGGAGPRDRAGREHRDCARCSGSRDRYDNAATAVRVLYAGRDPFAQKLFVDRGADSSIGPGEAVIDADGVVGQVTRVLPTWPR